MSKQIIKIENKNKDFKRVGNSISTYFKVNKEGQLIIKWKNKIKIFPEIKEGMKVVIDCCGGFPNVYKFEYPKNPYKIINIIFGEASFYQDIKLYEEEAEEIDNYYFDIVEEADNVYIKSCASKNNKIKFISLHEENTETNKILFLDKTLTMKEFKKGLKEINETIKRIDKEENFTCNLPDDGLLKDYLKKYEWYLIKNENCSYENFFSKAL